MVSARKEIHVDIPIEEILFPEFDPYIQGPRLFLTRLPSIERKEEKSSIDLYIEGVKDPLTDPKYYEGLKGEK